MKPTIVITGMGTVNPIGLTVAETWGNAVEGVSGVGPITLFDSSDMSVHIAAEVKGFDPLAYIDAKEVRRRDRFEQLATAAAKEALASAGYTVLEQEADRVAVIISCAAGGLQTIQDMLLLLEKAGPRRLGPFVIPMFMANGASGMVGIDIGAKGPAFSVASACASGADGIGQAMWLLRNGVVDVALAGATEAPLTRLGLASFDRLGALSRRGADETPSPFAKDRDGLVMGEGAAVLVLETIDHARRRGAEILAELAGYAATADAFHVTAPAQNGGGGAKAIRFALADAEMAPDEIDYVSAHGTGTQLNDLAETHALKDSLGERAYHLPISSTKSMTGHMMGATGAVEAILCVQAIRTGIVPPTIHLDEPDPECDLDYVPNEARRHKVRAALSNAFGFGGHNAVLVIRELRG
ncbi:MAG: beta-ketoacyl-ACP synthase II [Anaerolineales bacterium]